MNKQQAIRYTGINNSKESKCMQHKSTESKRILSTGIDARQHHSWDTFWGVDTGVGPMTLKFKLSLDVQSFRSYHVDQQINKEILLKTPTLFHYATSVEKTVHTALTAGPPTSISPSFRCIVVGVFRLDSL